MSYLNLLVNALCGMILTPLFEERLVDQMNKGQAIALRLNGTILGSNCLHCDKKLDPYA